MVKRLADFTEEDYQGERGRERKREGEGEREGERERIPIQWQLFILSVNPPFPPKSGGNIHSVSPQKLLILTR